MVLFPDQKIPPYEPDPYMGREIDGPGFNLADRLIAEDTIKVGDVIVGQAAMWRVFNMPEYTPELRQRMRRISDEATEELQQLMDEYGEAPS